MCMPLSCWDGDLLGMITGVVGNDINAAVRVFTEVSKKNVLSWLSKEELEGGMLYDMGMDFEGYVFNL